MVRKIVAGGAAALLLAAAGVSFMRSSAPQTPLAAAPSAIPAAQAQDPADAPLPEADPKTREERRFGRYDKDKDGSVAREEYLASRRKAFAKLDADNDGRLEFDEWAKKTLDKFGGADSDKSGALTPAEFATTAVKRSSRPRPKCVCPPAVAED